MIIKIMKLIAYLFLLFPILSFAQTITYSGVVRDKSTGKPIEHVSISVYDSNVATLTNSEGRFRITVPTSAKKINFNHLSYDRLDYVLSEQTENITIYLNDSSFELEEMVLYNRPIKDVIKEVIDNSKAKFSKDVKLNTYYREMMNINGKVYSYADGMLNYYFKNKATSNVIVEQSRALVFNDDFKNYEQAPIKFYLLDLQTIITSAFKFERIWNIVKNKNYDLYVTGKKAVDGRELKILYFEPSDSNTENYYKGTLIFDDEKKLVLEINIELSPKHLKNLKEESRIVYKVKFTDISFKQIFNDVNDRYFLAYDTRRIEGDVKIGEHRFSVGGIHELISVNSSITNEKPDPNKIYFEKTLDVLGKNFKTKFWENQNVILLNSKEEEMLRKINN